MTLKKHFLVLLAYSALAVAMTWPLAANFASAIPGVEGDASSYLWALGWAKTALVDLHVNPFHTDYVFYPLGGATQLFWAVSLLGVVSLPLQILFGLISAHNFLYLALTVFSAYGMFLLMREVITNFEFRISNFEFPAFVAGLFFAFCSLRLGYGLAFLNLYSTALMPFYVLFLMRATRGRVPSGERRVTGDDTRHSPPVTSHTSGEEIVAVHAPIPRPLPPSGKTPTGEGEHRSPLPFDAVPNGGASVLERSEGRVRGWGLPERLQEIKVGGHSFGFAQDRPPNPPPWRDAILAGILLGLNAYVDLQILTFLALFSVGWVIYALADVILSRSLAKNLYRGTEILRSAQNDIRVEKRVRSSRWSHCSSPCR
jgi:hypothetical protein